MGTQLLTACLMDGHGVHQLIAWHRGLLGHLGGATGTKRLEGLER